MVLAAATLRVPPAGERTAVKAVRNVSTQSRIDTLTSVGLPVGYDPFEVLPPNALKCFGVAIA